jgi:hypothetical protein
MDTTDRRRLLQMAATLPTLAYGMAARAQPTVGNKPVHIEEHFTPLSLYDPKTGQGRWSTVFNEGPRDAMQARTHGPNDDQCYIDPMFAPEVPSPFSPLPGGGVRIHAGPTPAVIADRCFNRAYVSGMLSSEHFLAFTYGRCDITCRLAPSVPGAWPALWFVPLKPSWPPEIDLLEVIHGEAVFSKHSTEGGAHVQDSTKKPELGDLSGQPHTYTLIKKPNRIDWLLDGNTLKTTDADAQFDQPFYLRINLAIAHTLAREPLRRDQQSHMDILSIKLSGVV